MIPNSLLDVRAYWDSIGVEREVIARQEPHGEDEFFRALETVGLPVQEWWFFHFFPPLAHSRDLVVFGRVGDYEWKLWWHKRDRACFVGDTENEQHFSNSSFLAFNQFLVIYDQGYRRVQRECPGDSGEDWQKGDVIIETMESEMRSLGSRAFEDEDGLWPRVLSQING